MYYIKINFLKNYLALVVILSLLINPSLAFINNFIVSTPKFMVILFELLAYFFILLYIYFKGFREKDSSPLYIIFIAIYFTFLINMPLYSGMLDGLRNFLIIGLFTMVGSRLNFQQLKFIFGVFTFLVMFFLILEIIDVQLYVNIFNPSSYFEQSRGLIVSETNETGLFGAALGFENRFSYGIFNGARTSSIFLEQVGLGNFGQILLIYTLCFWSNFKINTKVFFMSSVFIIITSTESRAAGSLCIIYILIFLFRNILFKRVNAFVMPLCILLGSFFTIFFNVQYSDTLSGRFYIGMEHFFDLSFLDYLGLSAAYSYKFADSGYAYLMSSSTIFGFFALYFYLIFYSKQKHNYSVLYSLYLSLYIYANLIISGSSVFSIKTAPLIWVLFGFFKYRESICDLSSYQLKK